MNGRAWGFWGLASVALALALFRGALWGERLLAPLDLAPALLAKYRWLDPEHSGIPANHYIIDQLTYDLPLQHTLHDAWRRGEVPWWDPYTFGGRPLLADAHVNGTDPVRLLCYALLPFELAYNWTLILHWALAGAGLLALLRSWGLRVSSSVGLALAGQCAGYHALFFGHPWNSAAFLYYPWLWRAWEAGLAGRGGWAGPGAALAVAAIFYAGNLQSHAYLVVFALVFLLGYGGRSAAAWRQALPLVAGTGLLGALLAAPVLGPQVEFYRLSVRPVSVAMTPVGWLSGLASLTAFHPWALGTYRSLDLSKLFGQTGLGFALFIGSAAAALALVGAWRGRTSAPRPEIWRTALGLVLAYLLILSTPLQSLLYTRAAGLAVLGGVVLAALGIEVLRRETAPWRRWGWGLAGLALGTTLTLNVVAWGVYPRVWPRVQAKFQQAAADRSALSAAPVLREFQARNLPREISLRNPETVLATLGLLAVAGLCLRPEWRGRRGVWPALLVLNLTPPALFYGRFIPNHPVRAWRLLQAGGPEQRRAAVELAGTPRRLREVAPSVYDQVFPNCLGHLAGVRVLHGYSALVPRSFLTLPPAEQEVWATRVADATYTTPEPGRPAGRWEPPRADAAPAAFQWEGPVPRAFRAELVSLNVQRVRLEPGPAGTLLWTETAYPGWRAELEGRPVPLRPVGPCFSALDLPAGTAPAVLTLRYRPTGWSLTGGLAAGTALACAAWGWAAAARSDRRRTHPA